MTAQKPISETLRHAINASELPFLALERETGVLRQCLMLFARGEAGISLQAADKLAVYFGLELHPASRTTSSKTASKRKGT